MNITKIKVAGMLTDTVKAILGAIVLSILVVVLYLVAALFLPSSAYACDEVYLGALSYHVNDDRDLKSEHALLACNKSGWIVGAMDNSFGDPTALLGKSYNLFKSKDFESRVYIGVTYGYYGCDNSDTGSSRSICPAVIPEISYTKYRVKPAILLMGNAVAISAKIGF